MQQLTPNVFVETGWQSGTTASPGSNSSFVVTGEGVVMIDAPQVPANALKWREIIAAKGPLRYLINTEFHADHSMGDYFFPVPGISHEETRRSIPEALESPAAVRELVNRRYPENLPLVEDYEIRLPSITFTDRLTLHLGDHTIDLLHLPGHTPGQIAVHVPGERVVFTGDNFSNGFQPALSYAVPLAWLDSLDRLLGLDVDAYVPGQGVVGRRVDVEAFAAFLRHCVETVQDAARRGLSRNEIIDTLEFEDLLPARHPGREQQCKNVARIYDMVAAAEG